MDLKIAQPPRSETGAVQQETRSAPAPTAPIHKVPVPKDSDAGATAAGRRGTYSMNKPRGLGSDVRRCIRALLTRARLSLRGWDAGPAPPLFQPPLAPAVW